MGRIGLDDQEIESLKSLSIDPDHCIRCGEKTKELQPGTYDRVAQSKTFGAMDKQIQSLCDKLVTTHLINKVETLSAGVESDFKSIGEIFDMPGSLS